MTLDPKLAEEIIDAVDQGFDEQVEFVCDLVRHPSLRGQEHTAQDFWFDTLKRRGYAMDRWQVRVEDIEHHPGFSPVKVDYSNAINVVERIVHARRAAPDSMGIWTWSRSGRWTCGNRPSSRASRATGSMAVVAAT